MRTSRSLFLPLVALSLVAASRLAAAQPAPMAPSAAPPPVMPDPRLAPPGQMAPGQALSCASCYAAPGYAAPAPGYAPMYVYAPQPLRLSDADLRLLASGEISTGQHVAGSILAISPGFGLGHLVQGRWLDRGWIYTVGEAASLALVFSSIEYTSVCASEEPTPNGDGPYLPSSGCSQDTTADGWRLGLGLGVYVGLRLWEIVDAIAVPTEHNRKVRELRARVQLAQGGVAVTPFLAPTREGGAMAGVAARF